uniref:Uncharacterized protein n=1 Tax=Branchiostoma floridae TaxID=7739 RepID=C3Z6H7_BRAFL|eukprot:XP_002595809.1 hypothetical protein BRAFLDRAFT_96783 [Branchiostoma floridae]
MMFQGLLARRLKIDLRMPTSVLKVILDVVYRPEPHQAGFACVRSRNRRRMSSEKLTFGRGMHERSARRDRAGGPSGALVGVLLGASAVFASAVVLAVIVQNIGHEMGELRARVERDREDIAKLQARAERDQTKLLQEIVFLRERIVVLETQSRDGSFLTSNVEQQTPDERGGSREALDYKVLKDRKALKGRLEVIYMEVNR